MEHYFTKEPHSKLEIFKIKTILKNKELEFYTATGLFSYKHLDIGTALLINHAIIRKKSTILDLACGYGAVGIALKLFNPTIEATFSDINERAVSITQKNLDFYGMKGEVLQSDGFEHIPQNFTTILLNPPQTAGKETCFHLIEQAYNHLTKNGTLQLVARHNKGGQTLSKKMQEVFGNVSEGAKKAGYRIYLSKK